MNKTWKIIKREIKAKIFTKGFLIGTILGPLFIIGVSLGPSFFLTLNQQKDISLYLVDKTGLVYDKVVNAFTKNEKIKAIHLEAGEFLKSRKKFFDDIEKKKVNAIVVLPSDVLNGGKMVYMAKSVSDFEFIEKIRHRINAQINQVRLLQANLNADEILKLTAKVDVKTVKISKGEEQDKGFAQEFLTAFIFLMMLYMTTTYYGAAIMRGVIEEKSSKIVEILLSSCNSFNLMMGKLFGIGLVGLIQYSIWIGMSLLALWGASSFLPQVMQNISISFVVFPYFLLFFIIGYFEFSALYAAAGAMCSNQEDAQSLAAPITILIIMPFMLSFMIIGQPTSTLSQFFSMVPFFTPMLMFMRIVLATPPAIEIIVSVVINIVTIVVLIWLAAKIYRTGILIYGKRPTLPEIIRWVRHK